MITLQQWDGARWVDRQVTEAEVAERGLAWRVQDALTRWNSGGRLLSMDRLYLIEAGLIGWEDVRS